MVYLFMVFMVFMVYLYYLFNNGHCMVEQKYYHNQGNKLNSHKQTMNEVLA